MNASIDLRRESSLPWDRASIVDTRFASPTLIQLRHRPDTLCRVQCLLELMIIHASKFDTEVLWLACIWNA